MNWFDSLVHVVQTMDWRFWWMIAAMLALIVIGALMVGRGHYTRHIIRIQQVQVTPVAPAPGTPVPCATPAAATPPPGTPPGTPGAAATPPAPAPMYRDEVTETDEPDQRGRRTIAWGYVILAVGIIGLVANLITSPRTFFICTEPVFMLVEKDGKKTAIQDDKIVWKPADGSPAPSSNAIKIEMKDGTVFTDMIGPKTEYSSPLLKDTMFKKVSVWYVFTTRDSVGQSSPAVWPPELKVDKTAATAVSTPAPASITPAPPAAPPVATPPATVAPAVPAPPATPVPGKKPDDPGLPVPPPEAKPDTFAPATPGGKA